jgi:uncharacterized protein YfbU (UPF0304 family)
LLLKPLNQLHILEKLDLANAENYAENREIIAHGYTAQYDEVFGELYDEMPMDECLYVYNVLDLFRLLIQSYDALEDKQGLLLDDIRFPGFDGNNESKRHAFVLHLKKQGKWTETLTGSLNSHSMTTMTTYPHMLENFAPIKKEILASGGKSWLLTADQIRQVIS